MDAKCQKCEGTEFSIKKLEEKAYCFLICNTCGNIIGVLEDIDFNKSYNRIIKNHGFFEKRFNDMETKIEELENQNKAIFEMTEITNNNVYQILKKVK